MKAAFLLSLYYLPTVSKLNDKCFKNTRLRHAPICVQLFCVLFYTITIVFTPFKPFPISLNLGQKAS